VPEAAHEAAAHLQELLRLWRGDVLAGFENEEWAAPTVARLFELRDGALEDLAAAQIAIADHVEAAAGMRDLLGRHPYRDRACGLLMRALAAQGRQTDALRAYQEYRARLADDVGVEPGHELQAIDQSIAEGRHTPAAAPLAQELPGNVRPPLTTIIGREPEISELLEELGMHRLVTLIGVGGVEKTRMAVEAARRVGDFPGGVWMVELGRVTSADGVSEAVARTLGTSQTPGRSPTESVAEWCETREPLIILDNCEHVISGVASLVEAVLNTAPRTTVLTTSREALMLRGERVSPVAPLPVDGDAASAVELFVERARAELPTFDPLDLDAVDVLSSLVDRSLVVRADVAPEYRMLETIRAFGRERLELGGASDAVRADHSALMRRKVVDAVARAAGPAEAETVAAVQAQLEDYADAVRWALAVDDVELALDITEGVWAV